MKTTLPFSTISYNSAAFLELKLNEHLKAHTISFWAYVTHQPEEDERKEHHHVWIVPSRGILTDSLMDDFLEFDPEKPNKPRACLPCSSSKNFADWYLYAVHDEKYLLMKGQTRKYHYRYNAVKTSNEDYLLELYKSIDITKLTPYEAIKQAVGNGLTFDELVAQGQVPIPQFDSWRKAFASIRSSMFKTNRDGRPNHEPDQDDEQPNRVPEIPADIDMEKAQMSLEDWDKCPDKEKI